MQYGGTTDNHISSGERETHSHPQYRNIVLFTLVAFTFLSPVKAYSGPTPGSAIIGYARTQVGQAAQANTCEVFAEQALKAAGDPIPPQEGASQAWSFFQSNWQQYGPCQPQQWDSSKVAAGDLVFWSAGQSGSSCDKTYGHVAIYDGAGGLIENAGRGITNDHSVNYPCTGSPTGFVPMTTCTGGGNFGSGTYTANGNTYSTFPQQNAASMSALLPMMMMSSMMSSMMTPMMSAMTSAMSGLNSGGSGSNSSGTASNTGTSGATGSTGSNATGSTTSTAGAGSTTSVGTSSATAAGTTNNSTASGSGSPLTNLLNLIQTLLDNSGTASGASGSATQAASDVEQVDQQANDETADAEPSSAITPDGVQTNNAAAPPDPTQDYHQHHDGHSADHRLSCAYAVGASVANCRSAPGATQ